MGLTDAERSIQSIIADAAKAAVKTLQDVLDNPEGCWTPKDQLNAATFLIDLAMRKD